MSERLSRINDYKSFRDDCERLFTKVAKSDKSHSRLDSLFSLNICPKGRFGGVNEKEIEVFYGNRPIGSQTKIGQNFQSHTKLETAHGSTLSYSLTDSGHIICALYPAASENQRPIEDFILIEYIKEPNKLKRKYKKHWNMFVSYMESTCIDGEPNLYHRLQTYYLRNFKPYSVDSRIQQRKSVGLFKEVGKYILTIGLSGFLILAFTLAKDKIDSAEKESDISKQKQLIERTIKPVDEDLKAIIKNTNRLEEISDNTSGIAEIAEKAGSTTNEINSKLTSLQSQVDSLEKMLDAQSLKSHEEKDSEKSHLTSGSK